MDPYHYICHTLYMEICSATCGSDDSAVVGKVLNGNDHCSCSKILNQDCHRQRIIVYVLFLKCQLKFLIRKYVKVREHLHQNWREITSQPTKSCWLTVIPFGFLSVDLLRSLFQWILMEGFIVLHCTEKETEQCALAQVTLICRYSVNGPLKNLVLKICKLPLLISCSKLFAWLNPSSVQNSLSPSHTWANPSWAYLTLPFR